MNEIHEILIAIVISAIVGFQIFIAWKTSEKIDRFKTIIPSDNTFETIKVYIPESHIKSIQIDDILSNLEKYSSGEALRQMESNEEPLNSNDKAPAEDSPNEVEEDPEALIWISREMEEKRIKYRLLKSFELLGWTRIR